MRLPKSPINSGRILLNLLAFCLLIPQLAVAQSSVSAEEQTVVVTVHEETGRTPDEARKKLIDALEVDEDENGDSDIIENFLSDPERPKGDVEFDIVVIPNKDGTFTAKLVAIIIPD